MQGSQMQGSQMEDAKAWARPSVGSNPGPSPSFLYLRLCRLLYACLFPCILPSPHTARLVPYSVGGRMHI